MPHTFSIALSASKQPALTFPPVCVGCGAPQACESTLRIERLVMRGQRQTPLRLRYQACTVSVPGVIEPRMVVVRRRKSRWISAA